MKIVAVVPAAGKGVRFKSKIPKPLVFLGNQPILIHTLKALSKSKLIDNIVVVVDKDCLNKFKAQIKKYNLKKVKRIISGGPTRRHSVYNGLKAIDKDADLVFIHDGVRPFIDMKIIADAIKEAHKFGASVVAVPAKSTIKEVDSSNLLVRKTLAREMLWEIQTPQVFKRGVILNAYKRSKNSFAFDDASLVEKLGNEVKIVKGSYRNIKITTPEDLLFAKALLKKKV